LGDPERYCVTVKRKRISRERAQEFDLAMRLSLPLATSDRDLRKAAHAEGIEPLGHQDA
jgi:hypothetical protein